MEGKVHVKIFQGKVHVKTFQGKVHVEHVTTGKLGIFKKRKNVDIKPLILPGIN